MLDNGAAYIARSATIDAGHSSGCADLPKVYPDETMSVRLKARVWLTAVCTVSGLGFSVTPAAAHHAVGTPEGEFAPQEASALGADHAADHAAKPDPAPVARLLEPPQTTPPNALTGGPPEQVGRWQDGPGSVIDLPNYAIHTVMLPTGRVLFWGYPPAEEGSSRPNGGEAAVWDPALGTGPDSVTEVDPPMLDPDGNGPQGEIPAPLYCSGQTLLPNGDVIAAGGNLVWPSQYPNDAYGDYAGLDTIYTFNPFAGGPGGVGKWVAQERMEDGRWYPSQVLLGDGRTPIIGGYTDTPSPGSERATDSQVAEIYKASADNGGQGSVNTIADDPDFRTALYPHLFTLPNNRVLLAGPAAGDSARLSFDPGQPAGRLDIPSPPDGANRIGGTAVLRTTSPRGGWTATQFGGYDDRDPINPGAPQSQWEFRARADSVSTNGKTLRSSLAGPTQEGRSYANTILLPDGSMVTLGGGGGRDPELGNYFTSDQVELKQVEVYDPETNRWSLGPNQREYRAYHSTAVLLPDGRIFSAGDDYHEVEPNDAGTAYKASTTDTAELYRPAYLYAPGARARITRVPAALRYGDDFGVRTFEGRGKSAVLMAPGATTHGADMSQRMVPLKKLSKARGRGLNLKINRNPAVTPPGYYMLFVLNAHGKPSVARWVRIDPKAPAARTLRVKRKRKR